MMILLIVIYWHSASSWILHLIISCTIISPFSCLIHRVFVYYTTFDISASQIFIFTYTKKRIADFTFSLSPIFCSEYRHSDFLYLFHNQIDSINLVCFYYFFSFCIIYYSFFFIFFMDISINSYIIILFLTQFFII